jgi:hypothetical protein
VLLGIFPLANIAQENIVPWFKETALHAGAIKFYFNNLSDPGRDWVFYQIAGLAFLFLFLLFITARIVRLLALINFNGTRSRVWFEIIRRTSPSSGIFGAVIIIACISASWWFLSEQAFQTKYPTTAQSSQSTPYP